MVLVSDVCAQRILSTSISTITTVPRTLEVVPMSATHFTQLPFVRTSLMGKVVLGCTGTAEEKSSDVVGGASLRTQGAREGGCKPRVQAH